MDNRDIPEALSGAPGPDELVKLILGLKPTLDRVTIGAVSEYAYLSASGELKSVATKYLAGCAQLYTKNLSPSFHMVPWDERQLLAEDEFSQIYESIMRLTSGFEGVTPEAIAEALQQEPRGLVVFRMMAAYSRNQVSYLLSDHYGITISGDDLRTIERRGRSGPASLLQRWGEACPDLGRLIYLAVRGELLTLREGVEADKFRMLTDKVDTRGGWESVARVSREGLPYSVLLYQRYIGSVFGQAINASTSQKADLLEGPVEKLLRDNRIPFYRVGAREKVPGWEQAPDFFMPSKEDPTVLIEAKVAEDGGTARDKASRIERLSRQAYERGATLISVIDGLGFFRINDVLAPILGNSKGLVFSSSNLTEILEVPAIQSLIGTASS